MTSSSHLHAITAEDLLEMTHDTVMAREPDGTITYWNHGAEAMYGFSRDKALGQKSHTLLRTVFTTPLAAIERELEQHGRWDGELIHYTANNQPVIVSSRWSVKQQPAGITILEINHDITAKKETESAFLRDIAHRNDQRMQLVVEAAPNGMILTNSKGNISLVNSRVELMFGYARGELLGQPIRMLFPQRHDNPDSFKATGARQELFGRRKDTELFQVEVALSPIEDQGENFIVASVVDITERKRAEKTIRESEARFRLLMSGIKDYAIFLLDAKGFVVSWDEGAQRIKGYQSDEIIGKHLSVFYPLEESESGKPYADLSEAARLGRHEDESWRVRKDASRFIANNVIVALHDDNNGLLGFVKVTRDITERKRTDALLQNKLLELERSNEDLQQFAYVCSHDLQEPLRVISNYTQLLIKRYTGRVLDDSASEFVEYITDASKRMQELINALLLYSRVQTTGNEFSATNSSEVVESAILNLHVAIDESGATIHHLADLPLVQADRVQLTQVFQNLISNAVKFRSERPLEVWISAQESPTEYLFTVKDNGLGFDVKYADRIFVIFQRLHPREAYPGSGIGLAICKKIIERHGGRIWVDSTPGEGSAFHFTVPKATEMGSIK
ncbi:MAG TPA: PAS domain S-box protein [Planktothrix sp.]|jgi:PAS domain S-box-containing protein